MRCASQNRVEQVADDQDAGGDNGDEGGYLLHKFNCPYNGVSGEHRELCTMDQILVDEVVGKPCCRTGSAADNGMCCTYQIGGTRQEIALVG